jgi:hypothetical protein
MRVPNRRDFDQIRFAVWNVFEIVLMILAMIAVIMTALRHIR